MCISVAVGCICMGVCGCWFVKCSDLGVGRKPNTLLAVLVDLFIRGKETRAEETSTCSW